MKQAMMLILAAARPIFISNFAGRL